MRKPSKKKLGLAAALLPEKPAPELPEHEQAYHAAKGADEAWQLELCRLFGGNAGDARYDQRGVSTPKLKELCAAKIAADERLAETWRKLRPDQSTTQPTA